MNDLVNTIIMAESSGRAHVVGDGGKSRGLMQIQEGTWKQYTQQSFNRAFDADANRKVGEAHVRSIIERYGNRASRAKVLYSYNTGKFIKPGKSLPKWVLKHPNKIYRQAFSAEVSK